MIQETIKEIRRQQELAAKPLVNDARTMTTQLGNIRRAEENITQLKQQLRSEVQQNLVLMVTSGKNGQKFSEVASTEFGCLTYDADGFFMSFAEKIDDSFLGKTVSPSVMDIVASHLSDLAHEVGIVSYNYPQFRSQDATMVSTKEEMAKAIQQVVVREVGSEIVALMAINEATNKIVESEFAGQRVPLVIQTKSKELATEIAASAKRVTRFSFVVNTGKEVTAETVEKKLTEISAAVQKGN